MSGGPARGARSIARTIRGRNWGPSPGRATLPVPLSNKENKNPLCVRVCAHVFVQHRVVMPFILVAVQPQLELLGRVALG